jgi:hypothetical protein
MNVLSKPYKGDDKAEWHPIKSLLCEKNNVYGNPQFYCPVCGEVYPVDYLDFKCGIECGDCKLGIIKEGDYVIIYEIDPSNPVVSFYDREK